MRPGTQELASYVNASARLFPHLAELLADFSELGSDPELVVTSLRSRGVGAGCCVLDLGCGKGAVAVAVARALGARVDAIDAHAPFIDDANRRAAASGAAARCSFRVGTLANCPICLQYDAALYVSVGDVLGTLGETIGALRRCRRPHGTIVIGDAYYLQRPVRFPGYEHLLGREETRAQLTAHGDRMVVERLLTREEVRLQSRNYQSRIEQRGKDLAAQRPDLAPDVEPHIEAQRRECALLESEVQPATWMLEPV